MRTLGTIFLLLGLIAGVCGLVVGCGSFFAWNGRHAVAVEPITPGEPSSVSFVAEQGRRYTVGVQVAFEREGLTEGVDGILDIDAKMPLVATLTDETGTRVLSTAGWLDPGDPSTVVLGRAHEQRSRESVRSGEIVAERFLGPYPANAQTGLRADVSLGPDRVGKATIRSARLVVYDDATLPSIVAAFVAAGVGVVSFVIGTAILVTDGLRRRRARRGGIRHGAVV